MAGGLEQPGGAVDARAQPMLPGTAQQLAILGTALFASASNVPMTGAENKPRTVRDHIEESVAVDASALEPGSSLGTTASTTGASTAEKADPPSINPEDDAEASGIGVPSGGGPKAPSTSIGVAQAVLVAARQLAHNCQVPGISEAASMVSIFVTLVADNRDSNGRSDREVKCCRSIIMMLQRATEVVGKVRASGWGPAPPAVRALLCEWPAGCGPRFAFLEPQEFLNLLLRLFHRGLVLSEAFGAGGNRAQKVVSCCCCVVGVRVVVLQKLRKLPCSTAVVFFFYRWWH